MESGPHFETSVSIKDPYRKLSIPGDFDLQPDYSLPIREKHRIAIRYSNIEPFDPKDGKQVEGSKISRAYSNIFEIPPDQEAQQNAAPCQKTLSQFIQVTFVNRARVDY